ncbi:hypothetical protein [Clostridium sp.]|uniref:hypothetical protein n=1 Tax=Clostridium sp. TaxID=1506 RepID=UPI0039921131
MNKEVLLKEIEERITLLEVLLVSVSEIIQRDKTEGKIMALKFIKTNSEILGVSPYELMEILGDKLTNSHNHIKEEFIKEGFDTIIKEYSVIA